MVKKEGIPEGYKLSEVGVIPKEWDVMTFEEVFSFLSSGSNSRSDLSEYGDTKYIHYGDIHTKWRHFLDIQKDKLPYINNDLVKGLPLLEEGDLVVADASEDYENIGISIEVKNIGDERVVAGLHTLLLRGNKELVADGYKGYIQSISTVKESFRKNATGISVYGISKKNLKTILIPLPPIPEQQAIAKALGDMEELITLLTQLIKKKKSIKRGTLQQLLSGKKRLSGFIDSWTPRNLGECLSTKPEYGINAAAVPYSDNLPVYIRITDITPEGKFNKGNRVSVNSEDFLKFILEEGDIVFARTGASTGKTYLYDTNDGQLVFAGFLIRVKVNQNILIPQFLKYYTETSKYWDWVKVTSVRSGQPGINGNEFAQLPIELPSLTEQKAISKILFDMDKEIEALQHKLEKYKAIKEGTIHNLLTGKVRLV